MAGKRGRRADATGRSGGRYFVVDIGLFESAAFRSLKANERAAFLEMAALFNGQNNGHLHMSGERLAERIRVHPDTARRCLRTLVDRGFLRLSRDAEWLCGVAREYTLTWQKVGDAPPTRDFKDWSPDTGANRPPTD
jgi:hypothetical protein